MSKTSQKLIDDSIGKEFLSFIRSQLVMLKKEMEINFQQFPICI